jgi:glucose/arabinose dehydrogenase
MPSMLRSCLSSLTTAAALAVFHAPLAAQYIGPAVGTNPAPRIDPSVFNPDVANYVDVASGLGDPVAVVSPPGQPERLIILQRNGIVRVVENGTLLATPFFDISTTYFNTQLGWGTTPVAQAERHRLIINTNASFRQPASGGVSGFGVGTILTGDRNSEQGLLGIAFPPGYSDPSRPHEFRRFYVYYTTWRPGAWFNTGTPTRRGNNGQTVVARMFADPSNPNRALHAPVVGSLPGTDEAANGVPSPTATVPVEERILTFPQLFPNHNGGAMEFGPDGMLYIGTGDGGSSNDPTNAALDIRLSIGASDNFYSWFGKLLRIDVNVPTGYVVPASNPFVGQSTNQDGVLRPIRPEIWAYGLRNPWRFTFDRLSRDLWIADVGQNAWEEINVAPFPLLGRGWNWGWRVKEGFEPTPSFASQAVALGSGVTGADFSGWPGLGAAGQPVYLPRDPVYTYGRNNQTGTPALEGFSVTGGYVYRGDAIPSYRGRYFFADYVTNRIWSFRVDGSGAIYDLRVHTNQWTGPSGAITSIASFGEDAAGEMLIVQLNGRVRRVVPQANTLNPADIAFTDARIGNDGQVDNGDFSLFITCFFGGGDRSGSPEERAAYVLNWPADIGSTDASPTPDGRIDNGDFSLFISSFFSP